MPDLGTAHPERERTRRILEERAALLACVRESLRPENLLSRRELLVFRLLAHGKSSMQIATELGVAAKTVHSHRRNIGVKLNVRSGGELVRYAIQWAHHRE